MLLFYAKNQQLVQTIKCQRSFNVPDYLAGCRLIIASQHTQIEIKAPIKLNRNLSYGVMMSDMALKKGVQLRCLLSSLRQRKELFGVVQVWPHRPVVFSKDDGEQI